MLLLKAMGEGDQSYVCTSKIYYLNSMLLQYKGDNSDQYIYVYTYK